MQQPALLANWGAEEPANGLRTVWKGEWSSGKVAANLIRALLQTQVKKGELLRFRLSTTSQIRQTKQLMEELKSERHWAKFETSIGKTREIQWNRLKNDANNIKVVLKKFHVFIAKPSMHSKWRGLEHWADFQLRRNGNAGEPFPCSKAFLSSGRWALAGRKPGPTITVEHVPAISARKQQSANEPTNRKKSDSTWQPDRQQALGERRKHTEVLLQAKLQNPPPPRELLFSGKWELYSAFWL